MPTEVFPIQAPVAPPAIPQRPFVTPGVQAPPLAPGAGACPAVPAAAAPQYKGYPFETMMQMAVATVTTRLGSKFCACAIIFTLKPGWLSKKLSTCTICSCFGEVHWLNYNFS